MRAAVVLSCLVFAAPLIAQQPSADESLDEEGRALFAAGRAAFGAERFDDALEHFQAAYDRSRRPELLYNVALAADRLGRATLALETYEKYLDSVPNSPFTEQATERIAALRVEVGTQREPIQPEPAQPNVPLVESPAQPQQAPIEPEPQPEPEPNPEPVTETDPPRSLRVPGFILVGGGAVSLATGIALIATGLAKRSDVEQTRSQIWTPDLQDDYDAATRRAITGIVLAGVGLAAAASGLLMVLLGPGNDASVSLDVGPGSLALRGRF